MCCESATVDNPKESIMAARLNKLHQDDVRKKIQTSQLLNRLTNHALGEIELSNTQVRAIEILLKKSIPDLQSIELSGDPESPIKTISRIEIVPLA